MEAEHDLPTPTAATTPEGRRERVAFAEVTYARCLNRRTTEDAIASRYAITPRQARKYLRAARKRWILESRDEQAPEERTARRAELRAAIVDLYTESREKGDLRAADRALVRLAEIDGLTEPARLEIDARVTAVPALPADLPEARRRAAELLMRTSNGGVELALMELLNVAGVEWPAELAERVYAIARGETVVTVPRATIARRLNEGSDR